MIFTTDAQLVGATDGTVVTLALPVVADENPSLASDGFATDDLAVLADEGTGAAVGSSWRVAGRRSMARHGASALDTEITVTLFVPTGSDVDVVALLNQAMMRLALSLAS